MIRPAGFTLIELTIAVAIFVMLGTLGLIMSMSAFSGFRLRSEQSLILALLEKARSRAMANIDQAAHGLCFDPSGPSYVLFAGPTSHSSNLSNETIPENSTVTISSQPAIFTCDAGGVVFVPLTGVATSATEIIIVQNGHVSDISITGEGVIK